MAHLPASRQPRRPGDESGEAGGGFSGTAPRTPRGRLGRAGEDRAVAWYETAGYEILDRNWRCPLGEIDVVCRKGRLLVVCEVKARSSDRFGTGAEAVGVQKRWRLRRLGALYLARYGTRNDSVRFDVVSIGPDGHLEVIEAAF